MVQETEKSWSLSGIASENNQGVANSVNPVNFLPRSLLEKARGHKADPVNSLTEQSKGKRSLEYLAHL